MKKQKKLGKKALKRVRGGAPAVYFNPKELSVDKSTPWNKHKTVAGDAPTIEFTSEASKKP